MPGNMKKPTAPKIKTVKVPQVPNPPQAKNLTPPNLTGIKSSMPKVPKRRNLYW